MRVVIVPTWYPNGKDKLMGIYHKEFTSALRNANVDTDMIYIMRYGFTDILKYIFSKKKIIVKENNYNVYIHKMLNVSKISSKLQLFLYTKKLESAIKKYKYKIDILHAHVTIPAGYACTKIGKKYNIPVIVTEHSSYFERFFDNNKYGKYVLENSYMTTVSNYMRNRMLKYTTNCGIIPNLVDTTIFDKPKIKDNIINLVSVSALRQGKHIDDIIKSLKLLIENDNIKNIHLDIIGDGYLLNEYKAKCNELNMDEYVSFLGKKTKEEISEIFKYEDIFVIASDVETFCIPGIEALASGLPIVSTDCLGPTEYIDSKCGVICKVSDPISMSNAIKQVINTEYDINYLKEVSKRFDSKNIINKSLDIYNKIKNNN